MNTKEGGHGMSKTITPADMIMAVESMDKKKAKWNEEHPNDPMPICPKCNNTGLKRRIYNEDGKEVFGDDAEQPGTYDYFEPCSCIKEGLNLIIKNNRKFASVPGLYADATFDNFRTDIYSSVNSRQLATCAKNDSIRYVMNFEKMEPYGLGLYIFSKARGSGKSRLASTISNELIKYGIRNKYASASQILSEIQKTWSDKNVPEEKIIRNYIEPKVLIIDDFGARSGQNWMDEKFFMIIDARYQEKKVTIFTSNYEISSLPFKDMRIIDRISDVDRFYPIRMPDETLRIRSRHTSGDTDLFHELIKKEV